MLVSLLCYCPPSCLQAGCCHWICALSKADNITRIAENFAVNVLNNVGYLLQYFTEFVLGVRTGSMLDNRLRLPAAAT